MLSQLQEKVLREEVVDYVLEKFESGLVREMADMGSEMERIDAANVNWKASSRT